MYLIPHPFLVPDERCKGQRKALKHFEQKLSFCNSKKCLFEKKICKKILRCFKQVFLKQTVAFHYNLFEFKNVLISLENLR